MRLLNTSTLELEEYIGSNIPKYAILSHTWERQEVSFADITAKDGRARGIVGFAKIQGACALAASNDYGYIWIDTCCIDKSSSAELTDAINSMYAWYKNADICYAYLSDVADPGEVENSRWFIRGWTLQELLAPSNVAFYNKYWIFLGMKKDRSFLEMLSRVTDIEQGVLGGYIKLRSICAARKMYWASHRQTTRIEDEAYCLMGIFEVNMPLIYGEGRRAFQRLQEAIMSCCPNDQSILAWYNMVPCDENDDMYQILASRPACFSLSGDITAPLQYYDGSYPTYPFPTTGMHLTSTQMELPAVLHYFARRGTTDDDEGVDCGIRHLVPKPPKENPTWLRTRANCYLILSCQVGLDPGAHPVLVLYGNATGTGFSRVERRREPRPRYRFQLNEPGHIEGMGLTSHRIGLDPTCLAKWLIGPCSEHLCTKTILILRKFALTTDPEEVFCNTQRDSYDAGIIVGYFPFNCWALLSQPRTMPVAITVSSLFPPERWDNKQLHLSFSVPPAAGDSRRHPSKGFNIHGAISLGFECTDSESKEQNLHVQHAVVIFGSYELDKQLSLWCQVLERSNEDMKGCKTDTDCLAKFCERDVSYYQKNRPLLPQCHLKIGPFAVLNVEFGGHGITGTYRHLIRTWIEDTRTSINIFDEEE